jgi:hypothetical protein
MLEKKVKKLTFDISVHGAIVATLIIIIFIVYYFFNNSKIKTAEEIERIEQENSVIEKEITDLKNRIDNVKKYYDFFKNNKDEMFNPIDEDLLRTQLDTIALNNNLTNFVIGVEKSKLLLDTINLKKDNMEVLINEINIIFYASTDLHIYSFVENLYEYLSKYYFPIFQTIEFKRISIIDKLFLFNLKSGILNPSISGNMKIILYSVRAKNVNFLNEIKE